MLIFTANAGVEPQAWRERLGRGQSPSQALVERYREVIAEGSHGYVNAMSRIDVQSQPLPHPHQDLDGWSLKGTELEHLQGATAREMAMLLHGIDLHVDTPWTYQRAADMLESLGHGEMALMALELWLSHPHAADQPDRTREVQRQRSKLQDRISRSISKARRGK